MKYFKKGDKVTCSMYGKGVVINIDYNYDHPISVQFEDCIRTYTNDGKYLYDCKRTLHQGHVDIIEPVLVPIEDYEKGEAVWFKIYQYWYIGFYDSDNLVKGQSGELYSPIEIRKFNNTPNFNK